MWPSDTAQLGLQFNGSDCFTSFIDSLSLDSLVLSSLSICLSCLLAVACVSMLFAFFAQALALAMVLVG
jgi:hypothetical protein